MKLAIYIIGGILLWGGIYGYLKTRGSVGFSPIPDTRADLFYQLAGLVGRIAMVAYLIGLIIVFPWWYALVFIAAGGLLTGVLFSRAATGGAAIAIVCVPLGILLAAIALFL